MKAISMNTAGVHQHMADATKYMRDLLPDHYTCFNKVNGVHCVSDDGIADEEQWQYTMLAIKKQFGSRFMEVYHETCANHCAFTVYIRPRFQEQLSQLITATWDGNLISKHDRDELVIDGYVCRGSGFNVVTPKGIKLLDELKQLKR